MHYIANGENGKNFVDGSQKHVRLCMHFNLTFQYTRTNVEILEWRECGGKKMAEII